MSKRTCTITACERIHFAKGFCSLHYQRQLHGIPMDRPHSPRRESCSVAGCSRTHKSRGFCGTHYARHLKGSPLDVPIKTPRRGQMTKLCIIEECEREYKARGYCKIHYSRWRFGGDLNAPMRAGAGEWGSWLPFSDGYIGRRRQHTETGYRETQLQHRYVMEQHLGRPMLPGETVHHKNGVRTDNRLENLELWSSSQPAGQRVKDKLAWAHQIIAQYENINLESV